MVLTTEEDEFSHATSNLHLLSAFIERNEADIHQNAVYRNRALYICHCVLCDLGEPVIRHQFNLGLQK
ncbi:hypothetical protein E4U22_004736 [Claviceps purpurea]|nr:hypothetical protein E4U22_004736 [Claviceps purpurea]